MDKTAVLIMQKDINTGYLEKELGSYAVDYDMGFIERIFAVEEGDERIVYMHVTVPGEFEDWEFNAILDNYGLELYEGKVVSIEEDEESYNPSWLIKIKFEKDDSTMEKKLNEILAIHSEEIARLLKDLKEFESEYRE